MNRRTPSRLQEKAAEGVIRRLLPNHAHMFEVHVDSNIGVDGRSSFHVCCVVDYFYFNV